MARKKDRPTEVNKEQKAAVDDQPVGDPALRDGHDQIIEEAPGISRAADISAPMGNPGDLSAFGRGAGLPDDLGVGDDPALDDLTNPGGDLGSTLLDDVAGDLSDPTDRIDGMSDGSGLPAIDDQTGWAMDGGGDDDAPLDHFGLPMDPPAPPTPPEPKEQPTPDDYDDNLPVDHFGKPPHTARQTEPPSDDDDDEPQSQSEGSDDPPGSQSMPAPDDGTGGEPDADDLIGGRGDVDPPPEAEDHGAGKLIGERGDVDPAPEAEEAGGAGGLDMRALGLGAVDPLEDESTLLGGDTGYLAEMTTEADLGDVEVEFDDSLADADIGEDV